MGLESRPSLGGGEASVLPMTNELSDVMNTLELRPRAEEKPEAKEPPSPSVEESEAGLGEVSSRTANPPVCPRPACGHQARAC